MKSLLKGLCLQVQAKITLRFDELGEDTRILLKSCTLSLIADTTGSFLLLPDLLRKLNLLILLGWHAHEFEHFNVVVSEPIFGIP